jgi:peptidoglycan/xylan/chitin deacetylase (PgdA/CDA1 family)
MNTAQTIPVLMYHHVSPIPGLVTCSPDNFRAQMSWLAENGWRTLSIAEFAAGFDRGQWPSKSVLLTFDDGYLDNWVYAHPILAEYGLTASIFLITGWLGDGRVRPCAGAVGMPEVPTHKEAMAAAQAGNLDTAFLRWSEVEAMRLAGTAEFHSHTHTHMRWDQSLADPVARDAALGRDLATSQESLHARLGAPSRHLCWPQGFFDAGYQRTALAAGFTHLYTTRHGVVQPGSDRTCLPRLVVKDKGADWFARRIRIYSHPWSATLYLTMKGSA